MLERWEHRASPTAQPAFFLMKRERGRGIYSCTKKVTMHKSNNPIHTFHTVGHALMASCVRIVVAMLCALPATAQRVRTSNALDTSNKKSAFANDSTETTDVPEGIYVWTVSKRFGDIQPATYDTIPHRFQNANFTSGPTGHYNYTGNIGAPRVSRLFSEQGANMQQNPFIFKQPYDFFLKGADELLFTNTKSPFTTLTYNTCGNKTNGEDRIAALFSVNAGKRLGMGFKADYLYGRGYYDGQSTADFDGTLYASYRGDQYNLHAFVRHTNIKTRENGGIESDDYVNRPESFPTKYGTADMPVNLAKAWNKLGGNEVFLTHRYSLGLRRYYDAKGNPITPQEIKAREERQQAMRSDTASTSAQGLQPRLPRSVKSDNDNADNEQADATPDSLKIVTEFIPVTSFIHTLHIDDNTRRFISNEKNNADDPGYFAEFYLEGDSANDRMHHLGIENTFAIELHEGFNKWMKMGLRIFGKHEYNSYDFRLPYDEAISTPRSYKENIFTVGAQLLSQQSRIIRYNVLGEMRTTGSDWGEFNVEANAALSIPMKRDSIHFDLSGFVRNERPSFYYRHFHARNAWWDNEDLSKMMHARVGATLRYKQTALTATLENIQNYLYFQESLTAYETSSGYTNYRHAVMPAQASKNVQLLAVTLNQDFRWGVFNWENEFTYQVSTNNDVFPVPTFTGYTNLYLLFNIAKVLRTEIGADARYFTRYYAPAYSPIIGQYVVQDAEQHVKTGNYPIVNVYANFHLKRTRFYIMCSHVNYSSGSGNPFLVPHYPINRLTIRFGISWNFVN